MVADRAPGEGAPGEGAPGRTAVTVVAVVCAATLAVDMRTADAVVPASAGLEPGWTTAVVALVLLVPGLLLMRLLPRHPVALVLAASGALWLLDGLAGSWARYALWAAPGAPGAAPAWWIYQRFGAVLLLCLPLLLMLFPDGRLPRGRVWRPLSVASLASTALLPLSVITVPATVADAYHGTPPPPEIAALPRDALSVPLPFWPAVLDVAYPLVGMSLLVPLAVVVARYRASSGVRRLQLRWLVWAGLVDAVLVGFALLLPDPGPSIALGVAIALTSGAVVVAVARHRLYEIDRLLSTTVVSVLLLALVGLVDVLVGAVAGGVLGGRDSALLAVAVVAVLYTPLRRRLWSTARRLVRGGRDDPYGALATLAERLELEEGPDRQLAAVAHSVAEAFRLPYVRVEIARPGGERAQVEHGQPTGATLTLPVVWRGEPIGRVTLCTAGRVLSERDQRLLGDLVRQAATAWRADELSTILQRHRVALVTAREEERRRLRRDLHDSLGPSLGAVSLRVETARNLYRADPAEGDRMLDTATEEVAAVLADVRRLAHDLRPPALDELGLAGAVAEQAARLAPPGLAVVVDGDAAELGPLPAAAEVAAYRIASEALTNVVRHAGAAHATVTLSRTGPDLVVEVADDGRGIGEDVVAGVGTLSLRERAAELGGSCAVVCPPEGGTVVRAVLPVGSVCRPDAPVPQTAEPVAVPRW